MTKIIRAEEPDYDYMKHAIAKLRGKFPFAQYRVCGRSLCSRAIFSLTLGDGKRPVVYAGGFHAQERLTILLLLRFFENLCTAIAKGSGLSSIPLNAALTGRSLVFLPCVNPDGVEIALHGVHTANDYAAVAAAASGGDLHNWNANARGVDLNHNFDAGWDILQKMEREAGIDGPAPRRFGGACPESEPETRAVTTLCRTLDARSLFAFHSQGEEIYWQYGDSTPKRSAMMARILSASSGYTLVENDGLASHGGAKDWFIQTFSRPAFTVEIGKGENPLPLSDFDSIYDRLEEMLLLGMLM